MRASCVHEVGSITIPARSEDNIDRDQWGMADNVGEVVVAFALAKMYCAWFASGAAKLNFILQKAKIGQGFMSDLESGRRKGTTAALKKIADVIKVPLDLIA